MNEATGGKKLLSLILMIGGLAMLVFSLALDFMGTKAAYRGALLVIGILAVIAGMYILPTLKYHRTLIYVIFLFPLLFAFVITVIIPLFLGLFYSFTNWNGIRYTEFVGFANYKSMFKDPAFIWSVLITFIFVVMNMILVNVIGSADSDFHDAVNELCYNCGAYQRAHEGACDHCRWKKVKEGFQ